MKNSIDNIVDEIEERTYSPQVIRLYPEGTPIFEEMKDEPLEAWFDVTVRFPDGSEYKTKYEPSTNLIIMDGIREDDQARCEGD